MVMLVIQSDGACHHKVHALFELFHRRHLPSDIVLVPRVHFIAKSVHVQVCVLVEPKFFTISDEIKAQIGDFNNFVFRVNCSVVIFPYSVREVLGEFSYVFFLVILVESDFLAPLNFTCCWF